MTTGCNYKIYNMTTFWKIDPLLIWRYCLTGIFFQYWSYCLNLPLFQAHLQVIRGSETIEDVCCISIDCDALPSGHIHRMCLPYTVPFRKNREFMTELMTIFFDKLSWYISFLKEFSSRVWNHYLFLPESDIINIFFQEYVFFQSPKSLTFCQHD